MALNKYLSVVILNVNGINAPIKSHRVAEWIRKHDAHICCPEKTHLRTKDLKLKGWKKTIQAKGQEKKSRVAILISDKVNVKTKATKGDTEGEY